MDRYEEALAKARAGKPLDEVFPELKESEDERIRKALIKQFSAISMETWAGIPKIDIISWLEKQKEQKPAEWSEEDEQYLLVCKNALNKYQRSDHWDANIISKWLEEKIKASSPQPKQERSEEDDFMAATVENSFYLHCGQMTDRLSEQYKKFFEKVKSLRPHPHWKPSEVQMDALAWYSGNSGVPPTGDKAIKSLYDDLKKL